MIFKNHLKFRNSTQQVSAHRYVFSTPHGTKTNRGQKENLQRKELDLSICVKGERG
jgi:hypothetical protein